MVGWFTKKHVQQVTVPIRCFVGKVQFVNGASWPDDPVFPLPFSVLRHLLLARLSSTHFAGGLRSTTRTLMASNSEPSRSFCATTSGPSSSGLTSVAYRKSCLMKSSTWLSGPTSSTPCPTSISCTSIATCSFSWMQSTTGDSGVSTRRFLRTKCLTRTS